MTISTAVGGGVEQGLGAKVVGMEIGGRSRKSYSMSTKAQIKRRNTCHKTAHGLPRSLRAPPAASGLPRREFCTNRGSRCWLREEQGEAVKDVLRTNNPSKRMADPLEIAKLAVYLASDDSAYVVGADFLIDGGVAAISPVGA